jgi:hypothetical protein
MYVFIYLLSQSGLKDPPLKEPKKDKIKEEEKKTVQ